MNYEIYLVENGERENFRRGIVGNCRQMYFGTADECRARMTELAQENFCEDESGYTAILSAAEAEALCGQFTEDQARAIGEAAAEKALAIYTASCVIGEDPHDWSIEWQNDLKWVMVREAEED